MKRTKIALDTSLFPASVKKLCDGAELYDSSCSPEAKVIYIERDRGYFIKLAPSRMLEKEALLDDYFYKKGLSAPVIEYVTHKGRDILVTARVAGEDATHEQYLTEPHRLAIKMGEILRELHETSHESCPVPDRMKDYFATVRENYKNGIYDLSYSSFESADDAYRAALEYEKLFKSDTLIHGDFCLPNFILDNWCFSGFIDLGNGGVGDRHIDLFWGAWTLNFNLKTNAYRDLFFDAYGKDKIDENTLLAVSAAEVFG